MMPIDYAMIRPSNCSPISFRAMRERPRKSQNSGQDNLSTIYYESVRNRCNSGSLCRVWLYGAESWTKAFKTPDSQKCLARDKRPSGRELL
jgi:hypothetical protein